ncbi:MAG: DUF4351 domain-containing protein [Anaerolineae bacterium]|nr:DUF4351 domain-containing protein [Gloeobacterales cyanobacterium ES-bin-313]
MSDHDSAFKKLLTVFFVEFIDLFCPDVRSWIIPESVEFLPQELFLDLTTISPSEESLGVEGQRRILDIAARVRASPDSSMVASNEEDVFFIIHVDPQSTRQSSFDRRMFRYFSRLYDYYDIPVYPIALFTFDNPLTEQPNCHTVSFPNHPVLDFRYQVIQLNRLSWRDYMNNPNPVACALMAKMRIDPLDRPRVKFECLCLLTTLNLEEGKERLISSFVDAYLRLNSPEKQQFEALIATLEPERREDVMVLTTSWKEEGRAEGLAEGLQQVKNILLRQIGRKFPELTPDTLEQVRVLNVSQLEALADALLDFSTPQDLLTWLAAQQ